MVHTVYLVFSILVAIQSDYFPQQHLPLDLCNRGALCCYEMGTELINAI